jgi:hypothetical protein
LIHYGRLKGAIAFSILTIRIMTFSITIKMIRPAQTINGRQVNDFLHIDKTEVHRYTFLYFAECHFVDCG